MEKRIIDRTSSAGHEPKGPAIFPEGTRIYEGPGRHGTSLLWIDDPTVIEHSEQEGSFMDQLTQSGRSESGSVHLMFGQVPTEITLPWLLEELKKPLAERTYVYVGYAEIETL